MNLLKIKQAAFLLDTISFYNSENRAVNDWGKCVYSPVGEVSPGCAIGRHLDSNLCKQLDALHLSGIEETAGVIFNQLPDTLKELSEAFLIRVQTLHDSGYYWLETGLSTHGVTLTNSIITEFKLPIKKLK